MFILGKVKYYYDAYQPERAVGDIAELSKLELVFAPDNNPIRSLEISNFQ